MPYLKITKTNAPLYLVSGGDECVVTHLPHSTLVLPTTPQEGRTLLIHAANQLTVQYLTHTVILEPKTTLQLAYLNNQWHTLSKSTPQKSWLQPIRDYFNKLPPP
jgi:hypothetical protein